MTLPGLAALLQDPAEVEAALHEVFARPEFAPERPSALWRLIGSAVRAVREFLRGLLPELRLGEGGLTILSWVVVAALLGGAMYLATRLARGLPWHRGARQRRSQQPSVGEPVPPPHTAEGWQRRATELARQGRWRDGALALYQTVLHRLAAEGAVHLDPAKTPGEYRRECRSDPSALRLLEPFLRAFEPVAFGARAADAAAFDRLLRLVRDGGADG